MKVSYEFDQSPYVTRAIGGLTLEGALGAVLTGLMVLLFLRDWRSAFIVVINIPLSLMGAVLALWLTKQTVNIMTLGGLALAVGILVDEATVSHREHPYPPDARPAAGPRGAGRHDRNDGAAVAGDALHPGDVHPTLFMVGAAKAMFLPLSLAVGFAMVASYLLSSTLVPILSVWVLRGHETAATGHTAAESRFARFQAALCRAGAEAGRRALGRGWRSIWSRSPWWSLCSSGRRLGTEIFPKVDAGQLQLRLRAPAGHAD